MSEARKEVFLKKMAAKNLGDPSLVVGEKYKEGDIIWLGIIYGRASGLSYRADPADETNQSIGLTGVFKGIPSDPALPTMKATRVYLPGEYNDIMVANVQRVIPGDTSGPISAKKGKPVNQSGNMVEFALKIGAQKALRRDKTWGYVYIGEEIGDANTADPLEEMEKKMGNKLLALPAPNKQTTKKK